MKLKEVKRIMKKGNVKWLDYYDKIMRRGAIWVVEFKGKYYYVVRNDDYIDAKEISKEDFKTKIAKKEEKWKQ